MKAQASMKNTLSSVFTDLMKEKKKEERNIILLVDGSGSIGSSDFDGPLRNALLTLVTAIAGEGNRVGVVQFSGRGDEVTKIECPLTDSATTLSSAITSMKQIGSGTNTLAGVKKAEILLAGARGAKSILLFTDGSPNAGEEPYSYIYSESMRGIDVVAIGIGSVVEENLRKMTTSGNLYLVQNFHALLLEVKNAAAHKPDPPVLVQIDCPDDIMPDSKIEKLGLLITLKNQSDAVLDGGFTIEFKPAKFFGRKICRIDEKVPADGEVSKTVALLVIPGALSLDFPEMLEYTLTYKGNSWDLASAFSTGFIRGDFLSGERYNILPFGEKGQGKSSLMNTLATSLSKRSAVCELFSTLNFGDHVTDTFSYVELRTIFEKMEESGCEKLPFYFYDIWGLDNSNFDQMMQLFPSLVRGSVPNKTKREKLADFVARKPNHNDHIHCLVIVVQLAAFLDAEMMSKITTVCKKWIDLDLLPPVIVVTGIDKAEDPKLREQHIAEMRKALPVQKDVFFVENYTKQQTRNTRLDMDARKILLAIRDNARRNKIKIDEHFGIVREKSVELKAGSSNNNNNNNSNNSNNNSNNSGVVSLKGSPLKGSPLPSKNAPKTYANLTEMLESLNITANADVSYELEDFCDSSVQEVEQAVAEFVSDTNSAQRLSRAIIGHFGPSKSQATWAEFAPPNMLEKLTQSEYEPEDFSDSSQEEIAKTLADVGLAKPAANAVARKLVAYFAVKN